MLDLDNDKLERIIKIRSLCNQINDYNNIILNKFDESTVKSYYLRLHNNYNHNFINVDNSKNTITITRTRQIQYFDLLIKKTFDIQRTRK